MVHLQIYRDKWRGLARLIDNAKKQYFTECLVEGQPDPKGEFKVIVRLMQDGQVCVVQICDLSHI